MKPEERARVGAALRQLRGKRSLRSYAIGVNRDHGAVRKAEQGLVNLPYLLDVQKRHRVSIDQLLLGNVVYLP